MEPASAWELAAGRPLLLDKKPQVAHSGDPKTLPGPRIPRGTPRFLCQNQPSEVYYLVARQNDRKDKAANLIKIPPQQGAQSFPQSLLRMIIQGQRP